MIFTCTQLAHSGVLGPDTDSCCLMKNLPFFVLAVLVCQLGVYNAIIIKTLGRHMHPLNLLRQHALMLRHLQLCHAELCAELSPCTACHQHYISCQCCPAMSTSFRDRSSPRHIKTRVSIACCHDLKPFFQVSAACLQIICHLVTSSCSPFWLHSNSITDSISTAFSKIIPVKQIVVPCSCTNSATTINVDTRQRLRQQMPAQCRDWLKRC